ncbi:uncharacterized protein LOC115756950 [Rhodamnia argentea]|uniref:Uncharacterized protein LOC115756950 n=1 Tax=Rhodamnia argentea TaxID=178133 RepID=A0A8B8R2W4_9MYRT|nr:uncharacterized protein LOC115756950 [Rhodamnia argentea]
MESPSAAAAAARASPLTPKLRLMCSYGGHIVPRPHDKSLCYVGGDTRIVVVEDRQLFSISALCSHLAKTLLDDRPFVLKYQLPSEDLDALVTVSTDEDLENMIEESVSSSLKHPRIRLFLFPAQPAPPESSRSIGRILEASGNWEDWFLDALNGASTVGADKGSSDSASVNCLLGLEDAEIINGESGLEKTAKQPQEVQSVPDSPMLATSSSFGSTSTASSHSVVNSPSIRVQSELEAARDEKLGIEEQFALMGVGIGVGQKQDDGSVASSAPPLMTATSAECVHRVFSGDERSYQGVPVNSQQLGRQQPQLQSLPQNVHLKSQQSSGLNSHSADSLSSESIWTNAAFYPNPVNYQELLAQLPPATKRTPSNQDDEKVNASDLISQVHFRQQTPDANHLFPSQSDQQQPEHHPPLPQQQFVQATSHFIPLQPTGGAQLTAYYSRYPPSHQNHQYYHPQHNQQFPVYYVRAAHDLAMQQPNISEASASAAVPSSQPQMPPNLVRDSPVATPHQQFAGYSQVHHQSRSFVAPATYGSEHMDPAHAWKYGGQPMVPMLYSHYQPSVASNNLFFSEGSTQLSGDKIRQQMQGSKPF